MRRLPEAWQTRQSPRLLALLHLATGALAMQQGDYAKAAAAQELVIIGRASHSQQWLTSSLIFLGRMPALLDGPTAVARDRVEEGIGLIQASGCKGFLAEKLAERGWFALAEGDESTAYSFQTASVALHREISDQHAIGVPLGYLGYIALRSGRYDEARSSFIERLEAVRGWHNWGVVWRLEGFAGLALEDEEDPGRAAKLYGAAQALLDSGGTVLDPIDRLGYDRYVAKTRAQLGEAAFAQAWAAGRKLSKDAAIAHALQSAATQPG